MRRTPARRSDARQVLLNLIQRTLANLSDDELRSVAKNLGNERWTRPEHFAVCGFADCGDIHLDEDTRVDIGRASLAHLETALACATSQGDEYTAAWLDYEIKLLRPYFREGVKRAQAMEAYYVDHPEEKPKGEMPF
jgi:hypothetical protein